MNYSAKINYSLRLEIILLIVNLLIPVLSNSQTLKVATYNIRYDNPNDGESAWQNRREGMGDFLFKLDADIVGLQEVLKSQFDYLQEKLSSYQFEGVGREDGQEKGEYSPVLFKKHKFDLLDFKTVWLSATPDKPSIGWDAALERIATILILREKSTGKRFLVVNTHYDHRGKEARWESSKLLSKTIADKYEEMPVILMGDLNAEPESEPVKIFADIYMDTFQCDEKSGPDITFAGFTNLKYDAGPRIDYIFLHELDCKSFSIMTPKSGDRNLSDHLPVAARVQFRRP